MRLKKDPSRRVRSELVYWRVRRSRPQNVPSDPIIPFPNGTVRFSAKELVVFVLKGLDDSSLAVYCQEWFKKDPSRRVRYELVYRCVHHSRSQNVPSDPNHIRLGGDGSIFSVSPGSKLPGYYHSVPSGQNLGFLKS